MPFPENQNSIAAVQQLWKFRTHQDQTLFRRRKCGDNPVNVLLCTDINAARRIVEKQNVGVDHQPAREQCLLLIASAQRTHGRRRRGALQSKLTIRRSYNFFLLLPVDESELLYSSNDRDCAVLEHAHLHHEPLYFAVFRYQPDSLRHSPSRRARHHSSASDSDLTGFDLIQPEKSRTQFASAS